MNPEMNTKKIKELLNSSTSRLSLDTLNKLRMARTRALDHQRIHHNAPVLSWLSSHRGSHHEPSPLAKPVNWVVATVFVAFLFSGASLWHNYTAEHEICEVDIAILTDDMPIHVYLD